MGLNTRACIGFRTLFRCRNVTVLHRRYKFQSSVGAYEDKTAVLSDADTVWADVRHMHMREAIDKLMADFNKFMTDNAGFKGYARLSCMRLSVHVINESLYREGAATLNDMKDMLASLPQYQEQREKVRRPNACEPYNTQSSNPKPFQFSLHLSMAQECMDIFERDKLPVVATVEQVCLLSVVLYQPVLHN